MPASVWSCQDLRDRNRTSQSPEAGSRVPRKIVSRETLRNDLRKLGETHPVIAATSRDPAKEFVGSTFFQPGDSTAKLRLCSSCGNKLILRSWATSVPVNDSGPVHIECRPLSILAAYARYLSTIIATMPTPDCGRGFAWAKGIGPCRPKERQRQTRSTPSRRCGIPMRHRPGRRIQPAAADRHPKCSSNSASQCIGSFILVIGETARAGTTFPPTSSNWSTFTRIGCLTPH
jgi:hypothetical protein